MQNNTELCSLHLVCCTCTRTSWQKAGSSNSCHVHVCKQSNPEHYMFFSFGVLYIVPWPAGREYDTAIFVTCMHAFRSTLNTMCSVMCICVCWTTSWPAGRKHNATVFLTCMYAWRSTLNTMCSLYLACSTRIQLRESVMQQYLSHACMCAGQLWMLYVNLCACICVDQPWTLCVLSCACMCADQPWTLCVLFIWRAACVPWPASRKHDTGSVAASCCAVEGSRFHPLLQILSCQKSLQVVGWHWNYEWVIDVVFCGVLVCNIHVHHQIFLSENRWGACFLLVKAENSNMYKHQPLVCLRIALFNTNTGFL